MAVTYKPSASYSRERNASAGSSTSWLLCDGTAVTSGIILLTPDVRSRPPGERGQMCERGGENRLRVSSCGPHNRVSGEVVVDQGPDRPRVPGRCDAAD